MINELNDFDSSSIKYNTPNDIFLTNDDQEPNHKTPAMSLFPTNENNKYHLQNIDPKSTFFVSPLTDKSFHKIDKEESCLQKDIEETKNFFLERKRLSESREGNFSEESIIEDKKQIEEDNQKKLTSEVISPNKITKKQEKSVEYIIKDYKVKSSQKMKKDANSLLKPINEKYKKKLQFNLPNSKLYTSKTKRKLNCEWLKYKIQDIFIFPIKKDEIGNFQINNAGECQKNNLKIIKGIYLLNKDDTQEIRKFLEMTLEDFFNNIFFGSDEFEEFCKDEKIVIRDEVFKKKKGYSILENFGFIRYIQG